jgi:sphingosine kinase
MLSKVCLKINETGLLNIHTNVGHPMKSDLFSITQNGRKTYSFMSQALGLMADLDIGTENLRWMGDTRFLVGLLRGGGV